MLSRRVHLGAAAALAIALAACSDNPAAPRPDLDAVAQKGARAAGRPIPDQYIVVFQPGVTDAPGLARRLAQAHGGTLRHTYQHAIRGFSVNLSAAAADALRRNPNVAHVEADQVVQVSQNAPSWGLDRIDQRDLPLNGTYNPTRSGSGVVVYVIDTGIETSHPEFGGRAWGDFDLYGAGGEDCNGHGTHVAGTVGGANYGVAKSAWLAAVRVLDCGGYGSVSDIIAGVDHVTYNHYTPSVANMSLRVPASVALDDAVRGMVWSGVTAVVAAGNESSDACSYSPPRVSEALTVGASNAYDQQAWFSNFGSCVDLYAPGEGITSAWLYGGTAVLDGTSMAAPHVAGVAALYLEGDPYAAPSTVNGAILGNATPNRLSGLGWGSPNLLLFNPWSNDPGPGPGGPRTAIHRLFKPGADHLYGLDPYEGGQYGYYLENYNYFWLQQSGGANHVALYRCFRSGTWDHFLSTASNCEGRTNEGLLGYIATSPVPGTVPLYRLSKASGYPDIFYTTDAGERQSVLNGGGWVDQGIQGYVYTQP